LWDGLQLFSGNVTVPPIAYLYFNASTGDNNEQAVISNFSATVTHRQTSGRGESEEGWWVIR
jgi:hypothetical protein